MYEIIKLQRPVLISPKEVLNNIAAENSLSTVKVLHSLVIAEERFVRPFLGWDMYEALLAVKNRTVTAANIVSLQQYINTSYSNQVQLAEGDIVNSSDFLDTDSKILWDTYLCKFIAECVRYVTIPESYAEFTEQGIMKNNPAVPIIDKEGPSSQSISLNDAKWLMDKWVNERLEPLKASIHTFICRDTAKYPLYAQPCECNDTKATSGVKTSWVDVDFYKEQDGDYDDCYCAETPVQVPSSPVTGPKTFREQWVTVPGQTQYPYPGQFNEELILNKLKNAELLSVTQEGASMYVGNGEGELIGMDPVTGRISWVTPAPDQEVGLRMEALLQK